MQVINKLGSFYFCFKVYLGFLEDACPMTAEIKGSICRVLPRRGMAVPSVYSYSPSLNTAKMYDKYLFTLLGFWFHSLTGVH